MADPISASAAILGILSAAPKIIQLFTSIISATKEASQGLQDAREEVKHVEISMRSLERHLSSLESIDPSRAAYIEVDHLIVMLTDMTLTFEGLEKLLDTLAPTKPLGVVRNTVAWSRHAKDINRYIEKLQRNKSSLSLMLNIIQSASPFDAMQSQYALHSSTQRYLDVHPGFSRRLRQMEDSLDLESTLSRHKLNGTSVAESEGDEGASNAGTATPSTAKKSTTGDLLRRTAHNVAIWRSDFEDVLDNTRAYQRCKNNDYDNSLATSGAHLVSWSIFSGLSLADISAISVISLPVNSEDIRRIKDWNLELSAHEIFAGLEPNDPGGSPDLDMLSLTAEQSSVTQDTQKKQNAEKKSIFSRTSTQSARSHRSAREKWYMFSRSRLSMSSGTTSSLWDGEWLSVFSGMHSDDIIGSLWGRDALKWYDSPKGIDHIDYQESVKALSYDEPWEGLQRGRSGIPTENSKTRRCNICSRPTEFCFWSTKEATWACEVCYISRGRGSRASR